MEKNHANIVYPKVTLKDVAGAFWQGIKPQKWRMFVVFVTIILANILAVITPIFYKQFFDVVGAGGDKEIVAVKLVWVITYVLVLNLGVWVCYRVATLFSNAFHPMVMANLKRQSYDYVMQHSYSFFTNNFVGSLVQRVNRFARAFENLIDDITWNLLPLVVKVIAILFVLYFINFWIAFIVFIWALIFLLFNVFFSIWKLKYDILAAETDSKTTAYLADTLTNQNTISLFNGFTYESRGFKDVTERQAMTTKTTWNLNAMIDAVQGILSVIIEFILFFFAIIYWQQGLVTVGVFILLQLYVLSIIDQLWGFTRIVRSIYQSYADAKEMVEIMLLPHEIKDIPGANDLSIKKGEVEFKELHFNFNETRQVLKNVNLVIKPGEKVALIGPSGAGKTTFVRLLLRFYAPTAGKIIVDGQDVAKVTQESLRKNISLVPQDPVLFHRTLAENIAYGKRDATRQEIERAATLAHCDEFIKNLPHGLETHVGERGIKLSGGERQRVAIARAILKNAPILILDEATSSLDSPSEMLIQDALDALMSGKTTIAIAHRLSTIQRMDRIIVIDNGEIVEQGSHDELLSKENSLYKKLWTLQAGGFLNEDDEEEEIAENVEDED